MHFLLCRFTFTHDNVGRFPPLGFDLGDAFETEHYCQHFEAYGDLPGEIILEPPSSMSLGRSYP